MRRCMQHVLPIGCPSVVDNSLLADSTRGKPTGAPYTAPYIFTISWYNKWKPRICANRVPWTIGKIGFWWNSQLSKNKFISSLFIFSPASFNATLPCERDRLFTRSIIALSILYYSELAYQHLRRLSAIRWTWSVESMLSNGGSKIA